MPDVPEGRADMGTFDKGRLIIYEQENFDAWIRSDQFLELANRL